MRCRSILVLAGLVSFAALTRGSDRIEAFNPAIDMDAHLRLSIEAARRRETHRLSEEAFRRMSREPGTLILDARSREKYDELHVRGAVNLSFSDIAVDSLARTIPAKTTRVLIYCNNNFRNAEGPFPTKLAPASLNLSTYITLYIYGYRNVYELGPLVDLKASRLDFETTKAGAAR
jgi:phage shock protein E